MLRFYLLLHALHPTMFAKGRVLLVMTVWDHLSRIDTIWPVSLIIYHSYDRIYDYTIRQSQTYNSNLISKY